MIKFYFFFLTILFLGSTCAEATHIKGGYISYTADATNPHKITVTLTTYIDIQKTSTTGNPSASLYWGDGEFSQADLISRTVINAGTALNIYKVDHVFPAPGTFTISYSELNRTLGLNNMPNSEDQGFYISTQVKIDPFGSSNSSVTLLNNPPFEVYLTPASPKVVFNLAAYDLDKDSLSYQFITPLRNVGTFNNPRSGNVAGYQLPVFSGLNLLNGDLTLDNTSNQVQAGLYSFAVKITEHRKNMPVAYTIVDFLILVKTSGSVLNPTLAIMNRGSLPINANNTISLNANQSITIQVQFAESQATSLKLNAYSELLTTGKATFTQSPAGNTITGAFTFTPAADLKRNSPYLLVFHGVATSATAGEVASYLSVPILVEAKAPTSIRDGADATILNAYPNPAENFIIISYKTIKANHELVVYDILGNVIKKQTLPVSTTTTLTRQDISKAGQYFYTISDSGILKQSGRFIFK